MPIRDVYFWSEPTGLMTFKGAEWDANAEREKIEVDSEFDPMRVVFGLSDARPTVAYTTDERPSIALLVQAINVRDFSGRQRQTEAQREPIPVM